MSGPQVQTASFPTANCSACDKTVLTYIAIEAGAEVRRCVHCDGTIAERLSWVAGDELEELGYYFGAPPEKKSGGCGSGAGGCGSCSR
jgi:hypothetical protein